MNWLTKKNIPLVIGTIGLLQIFAQKIVDDFWCTAYTWITYGNCYVSNSTLSLIAWGGLAFLGASLIPYLVVLFVRQEEVFRAWRNFSVWAVPLVVLITIFLANAPTGGGLGGAITDGIILTTILAMFGIYALASIVIIIRAWLKARKHPGQETPGA